MITLVYIWGASYDLLRRAPWRQLGGAAVLGLTVLSVYVALYLMVP